MGTPTWQCPGGDEMAVDPAPFVADGRSESSDDPWADHTSFSRLASMFKDRLNEIGYYYDEKGICRGGEPSPFSDIVDRTVYGLRQLHHGYNKNAVLENDSRQTMGFTPVERAGDDIDAKAKSISGVLQELVGFYRRFLEPGDKSLPSPYSDGGDGREHQFYQIGYDMMLLARDVLLNQLRFREGDSMEDFVRCLALVNADLHKRVTEDKTMTPAERQMIWDYLQLVIEILSKNGEFAHLGIHAQNADIKVSSGQLDELALDRIFERIFGIGVVIVTGAEIDAHHDELVIMAARALLEENPKYVRTLRSLGRRVKVDGKASRRHIDLVMPDLEGEIDFDEIDRHVRAWIVAQKKEFTRVARVAICHAIDADTYQIAGQILSDYAESHLLDAEDQGSEVLGLLLRTVISELKAKHSASQVLGVSVKVEDKDKFEELCREHGLLA